jgi:ABC-type nitrate/sulfonate/bicarbonate transport system permease component
MVAVVVIGLIGVVLDQIMRLLQNYASRHSVR